MELDAYTFPAAAGLQRRIVLFGVGGAGGVAMAVLGFIYALQSDVSHIALHGMTTAPMLAGVFSLATAWSLSRSVRLVELDAQGMRLVRRRGERLLAWDTLGWTRVQHGPLGKHRELLVYDTTGRRVAVLAESIEGFDELADLLRQQVSATSPAAEDIRSKKGRRNARIMAAAALGAVALGGANLWFMLEDQRAQRLLAEQSAVGDAKIVRLFLAPDGTTPRLEYQVTGTDGQTAVRDAELVRPVWDGLQDEVVVRVRYVPDEPGISRVLSGEAASDSPSPAVMYALCAGIGVLALLFATSAVLSWHGYDIDLDSTTGRLSIQRFGEGR